MEIDLAALPDDDRCGEGCKADNLDLEIFWACERIGRLKTRSHRQVVLTILDSDK
jgi:hypothetical protein